MISMVCIADQNIDLIYVFRLCLCAQLGQLSFHLKPLIVLIVVTVILINTSDLMVFRLLVAGCMIFGYVQLPWQIKFKVMYLF